jgi:hypothetical protein
MTYRSAKKKQIALSKHVLMARPQRTLTDVEHMAGLAARWPLHLVFLRVFGYALFEAEN